MTTFKPITRNRALVNVNSVLTAIIDSAEQVCDNAKLCRVHPDGIANDIDKLREALEKL